MHKTVTQKEELAQESSNMLKKSNDNYRNAIVKNESLLTQQTKELMELRKQSETIKKDADRLKEENEVVLK